MWVSGLGDEQLANATLESMLAIVRFDTSGAEGPLLVRAEAALSALSRCAGFERGWFAQSTDEPSVWTLTTLWRSVGAYRRALSTYDVKIHATPFMYDAREEPTGFEVRIAASADSVEHRSGDLAADATTTGVGDFGPHPRPH